MATAFACGPEFDFGSQNPFETKLSLQGVPLGARAFMGDLVRWASHAYLPTAGPKAGSLLGLLLNAWHMASETSPGRVPSEIPLGLRSSQLAERLGLGSRRALSRAYSKLCEIGVAVEIETPWAQVQDMLTDAPCANGYREGKHFALRLDKIASDFKANALEGKARAARQRSWGAFENTGLADQDFDAPNSLPVIEPSIPGPPAPITSRTQGIKKDLYPEGSGPKPKGRFITPAVKKQAFDYDALLKVQAILDGQGIKIATRSKYKYSPAQYISLELAHRGWGTEELDQLLVEMLEEGGVLDRGRLLLSRFQRGGDKAFWASEGARLRAFYRANKLEASKREAALAVTVEAEAQAEQALAAELDQALGFLDSPKREALVRLAEARFRHYRDNLGAGQNPYPADLEAGLEWWRGFLKAKHLLALVRELAPTPEQIAEQERSLQEAQDSGWEALRASFKKAQGA